MSAPLERKKALLVSSPMFIAGARVMVAVFRRAIIVFGISAASVSNWTGNAILGTALPVLIANIGEPITFWILAAFNAAFIVFTLALIPETKNIFLEGIENNLMRGRVPRRIGV